MSIDLFESAIEQARNNDRANRDANRQTRPSGGSAASNAKDLFERALESARQKDSETNRLTPSREQSGSQEQTGSNLLLRSRNGARSPVGQMLECTMNRCTDRGNIDTFSNPE